MLFRLHDGSLLKLDDALVRLSSFLSTVIDETSLEHLLNHALAKSRFKKNQDQFHALLTEQLTEDSLKDLLTPTSDLCCRLQLSIDQLPLEQKVQLRETLQFIQQQGDDIFEPRIIHLKFVKDSTLRHIVTFLQIDHPNRNDHMLSELPQAFQGRLPNSDIKMMLDPVLHPYIDFIRQINSTDLLDLSKVCTTLGVDAMIPLIGYAHASNISKLSETQLRELYHVPENNRTSALEKLRQIMSEHPWRQPAGTSVAEPSPTPSTQPQELKM